MEPEFVAVIVLKALATLALEAEANVEVDNEGLSLGDGLKEAENRRSLVVFVSEELTDEEID